VNKLATIPVLLASTLSISSTYASEFWADRLGGGPTDIIVYNASNKAYKASSKRDIVFPDSKGKYEINARSRAVVHMPFKVGSLNRKNKLPNGQIDLTPAIAETTDEGLLEVGAGEWLIEPDKSSARSNGKNHRNEAYIEYEESPFSLEITKSEKAISSGTRVMLSVSLLDDTGVAITNIENAEVKATVIVNDKNLNVSKLRDNGLSAHGDSTSGDGEYSGLLPLNSEGMNSILISLEGNLLGQPIRRSTVIRSEVSANRLKVSQSNINATHKHVGDDILEEGRYGLPLIVRAIKGEVPDIVETYAQVWGKSSNGDDIAIGWIGGLVQPQPAGNKLSSIPFSFHSGWLDSYPDVNAPLSLRNIEVRDIDSGDKILISTPNLKILELPTETIGQARSRNKSDKPFEPTPSMTNGVHPDSLNTISSRYGSRTGSDKIVLSLHGLCDGAKPTSGFSSVVRNKSYLYNGSRSGQSATRYATDVMQHFGFKAGKFRGIVAHSHGGMAAASLLQNYSYAFADNARSRPPNVVSMGIQHTPSPRHSKIAIVEILSVLKFPDLMMEY